MGDSSDSDSSGDRDAKFDALDAELAEQLTGETGFDPSSLHNSMEGLPKRKALKRQKSKKSGKSGQKAHGVSHV